MAKKTPSGKFRGKVTIGYAPDGKPIYKYVTAPTRRELENVKEAVREHYIFGRAIPRDVQFYEYAGQWYKTRKEPFISNASRSYYKTCFVKHLLPRFGMQHMKAITAVQIQEFVHGFAGTSKSQINNVIGTLKALFASAYAEGLIERDPTAVSYTHLDVYKRQALRRCFPTSSLERTTARPIWTWAAPPPA